MGDVKGGFVRREETNAVAVIRRRGGRWGRACNLLEGTLYRTPHLALVSWGEILIWRHSLTCGNRSRETFVA